MDHPSANPGRKPLLEAFQLAFELGYLIVIPLIIFAFGGRWLDVHFDTSPWFLLTGMGAAIIFTTVLLIRKFSKLLHDMNQHIPPKNSSHD